jgi:hypothetical protein
MMNDEEEYRMGLADKIKRAVASNFFTEAEEVTTASQVSSPNIHRTSMPVAHGKSTHVPVAPPQAPVAEPIRIAEPTPVATTTTVGTSPVVSDLPPPMPAPAPPPAPVHKGMTALQVAEMIEALPESMPTRSKRLTVRAALDSQEKASGIKAEHLLAEATLSKIQITQKLQKRTEEYEATMTQLQKIIADYEAEQTEMEKQLEAYNRVLHFLSSEVGNDTNSRPNTATTTNGIPTPFASQPNFSTTSREEGKSNGDKNGDKEENSDLPPHLRDGEVRKLLGIK